MLLTFFLLTFFFDAFFAGAFFLLAGFLRETFFLEVAFFATGFLREDVAVLRFLLADFFAGIFYSCRGKKRPGLYIGYGPLEALISGVVSGAPMPPKSGEILEFQLFCLFWATIVLLPVLHYTSPLN